MPLGVGVSRQLSADGLTLTVPGDFGRCEVAFHTIDCSRANRAGEPQFFADARLLSARACICAILALIAASTRSRLKLAAV